jgi:cellulose synthase/poly-beta-1,6-N-acetylglucosamine synthase-like glycosyltransferase
METIFHWVLASIAAVLAIPVTVLLVEIVAAVALSHRQQTERAIPGVRPRTAVLMPAHNEGRGLLPTLSDIQGQLRSGDRLVVVADNCTDDTAAVALSAGAEVVERNDLKNHGKGYALDYGLQRLASNPPEIVIMVDADCRLAVGTIDRLAKTCAISRRPVQALYLMMAPECSPINYQVAQFAWRVKNWVRPLGLRMLSLPCQLVGTGMAFPWDAIRSVDLASGQIVEDLKLGLDLTAAGRAPLFCPSALVTSSFPLSTTSATTQRQRWEHGHLGMIIATAPRLIWTAVKSGHFDLLALTLDLAVPPLSLFALLVAGMVVISSFGLFFGASATVLSVSIVNLLGFAAAVIFAWLKYGRDILPPHAIWSIVPYVAGKLPIYRRALSGRPGGRWVRTDRESQSRPPNDSRQV